MDPEHHPCPGCQQMPSHFLKLQQSDYNVGVSLTLHKTFGSFKSAVQAGCKLCKYIRVSCMGHVTDREFLQAESENVSEFPHLIFVRLGHSRRLQNNQDNMNSEERNNAQKIFQASVELFVHPEKLPFQLQTRELAWILSPVAHMPKACLVKNSTSRGSDLQFFERCLSKCLTNHTQCVTSHPTDHRPTRLLYVGTKDNPCLRLHLTDTKVTTEQPCYAALSHCWGGQVFDKLLQNNELEWTIDMPEADLPKTFREAVQVTRHFSLQFLWIDALCIIQDSADDWSREAARMAQIYSGAYITIAAAGATDSSKGLFPYSRPEIDLTFTINLSVPGAEDTKYIFHDASYFRAFLDSEPLCTRAWAVQERFLSPRVLHFTSSQMIWECGGNVVSQVYPDGFLDGTVDSHLQRKFGQLGSFADEETPKWYGWRDLVSHYSRRQMTMPDDKLVALSGLASHFQSRMGCEYLAGLWTDDLARELLWKRALVDSRPVASRRPAHYRAPSWSWASIESPIGFVNFGCDPVKSLVAIEGFGVVPLSEDLKGQICKGWINLEGRLVELSLALNPTGDPVPSLVGWSSLTDVAGEKCSSPEIESSASTVEAIRHTKTIQPLAPFWAVPSIIFDTSEIEQSFTRDCKAGSCLIWWLPIYLSRGYISSHKRFGMFHVHGLILQNVSGDVFSRVGQWSMDYFHIVEGGITSILQEFFDKFSFGDFNHQENHPKLFPRRKLQLI